MLEDTANLALEYKSRPQKPPGGIRADLSGRKGLQQRNRRLDRLDQRVTRIEKCLDLVEG